MHRELTFDEAIDEAIAEAMARDERIIVFGEDVPMLRPELYARFGAGRIFGAPISEAAFVGAAVGAAMTGLRPVVEVMLADFLPVAMDAVVNHMAKTRAFSGGTWSVPLVVRTACGGGYGDGGQHEQSLWGMLAHIPGLEVLVPSNPSDAKALTAAAILSDEPTFVMEHKLLSASWLEFLGRCGRQTVAFPVPQAGASGVVPRDIGPADIGRAVVRRPGHDLTIVSLAVGVHRSTEAAELLSAEDISCEVIDLRSVRPLDHETVAKSVAKTNRLLVVDEDYEGFGLSGELAALTLEAGLQPGFGRVCTRTTIPYARHLEADVLPNVERIVTAARQLVEDRPSEPTHRVAG